jgi:hypothetical protein
MPEEPLAPERPLTGDDIISEILRNSEAGQFSLRRTILLPSIYHVYLHPADYDLIRPVVPAITAEARAALIEHVEELNRRARPSSVAKMLGLESAKSIEYRILDPDWTVEFHPDAEEKLSRGDIEVFSELASAARPEFDGAMTRHVTRKRAGGEMSSSAAPAPGNEVTARVETPETPSGSIYGWLRYDDGGALQVYSITKPQTVIGRGGKAFWVDVKLNAPADVSREHCRIRRDAVTGRFFLKDVSQFGTSVDGVRVPSSLSGERDTNMEVEIPARATISLAGVFSLEFEAAERR